MLRQGCSSCKIYFQSFSLPAGLVGSSDGLRIPSAPPPLLQVAKANGLWVRGAFKIAVDLISWASETKFKIKQFTTHWLPEPTHDTGHVYGVRKHKEHPPPKHPSLSGPPQAQSTIPANAAVLSRSNLAPCAISWGQLAWTTSSLSHCIPVKMRRCLSKPKSKCYKWRPNSEPALTRMSLYEYAFFQLLLKSLKGLLKCSVKRGPN